MTSSSAISSVLVIEDSDEDFAAMERILRKSSAPLALKRCVRAEQAMMLLDEVQQQPKTSTSNTTLGLPSLIVLDLNLPGRDGRFVLSAVRSQPALRKIPVVIFSTSSDAKDITWCYENGANSYHVKDMDYDTFKRSVEQLSSYWLQSAHLPGAAEKFSAS